METLATYTNRDGDREVVLVVADGSDAPFSLMDTPADRVGPGTWFLLDCHETRKAATDAANDHAAAAVAFGSYEAYAPRAF